MTSWLIEYFAAALIVLAAATYPAAAEDISDISQLEPGSAALAIQSGEGNRASISQKYVAGGGDGPNQAVQLQAGVGNNAAIVQEGSQHSAAQEQTGSGNSSVIEQYGSGRAAAHVQIGDGQSATITQFGGAGDGSASVTVTQFNFGAGQ